MKVLDIFKVASVSRVRYKGYLVQWKNWKYTCVEVEEEFTEEEFNNLKVTYVRGLDTGTVEIEVEK